MLGLAGHLQGKGEPRARFPAMLATPSLGPRFPER